MPDPHRSPEASRSVFTTPAQPIRPLPPIVTQVQDLLQLEIVSIEPGEIFDNTRVTVHWTLSNPAGPLATITSGEVRVGVTLGDILPGSARQNEVKDLAIGGSVAGQFDLVNLPIGQQTLTLSYLELSNPREIIVPSGPGGLRRQTIWDSKLRAQVDRELHIELHRVSPPLNHVWMVNSHNSYWKTNDDLHGRPVPFILDQLGYYGLRSLELDLHDQVGSAGHFQVYHGDLLNTQSLSFAEHLDWLRTFNFVNPGHGPIIVLLELKAIIGLPVRPSIWDDSHTPDDLDRLLTEKLGPSLYTPAQFATRNPADIGLPLREVARRRGWPTVTELRGKFIFLVFGSPNSLLPAADNVAGAIGYSRHGGGPLTRKAFLMGFEDGPGTNQDAIFAHSENVNHPFLGPFLASNGIVRQNSDSKMETWNEALRKGLQIIQIDDLNLSLNTDLSRPLRCLPQQPGGCDERLLPEPGGRLAFTSVSPNNFFAFAYTDETASAETEWITFVSTATGFGGFLAAASLSPDAPYFALSRNFVQHRDVPGGPVQTKQLNVGVILRLRLTKSNGQTTADWSLALTQSNATSPDWSSQGRQVIPALLQLQGLLQINGQSLFLGAKRNGTLLRKSSFTGIVPIGQATAEMTDWTSV